MRAAQEGLQQALKKWARAFQEPFKQQQDLLRHGSSDDSFMVRTELIYNHYYLHCVKMILKTFLEALFALEKRSNESLHSWWLKSHLWQGKNPPSTRRRGRRGKEGMNGKKKTLSLETRHDSGRFSGRKGIWMKSSGRSEHAYICKWHYNIIEIVELRIKLYFGQIALCCLLKEFRMYCTWFGIQHVLPYLCMV